MSGQLLAQIQAPTLIIAGEEEYGGTGEAEQVKAAFASWLRPRDLVQVAEGPQPR